MGFFDLFKKRKTDSTFPENELERCLIQAKSDAAALKEFYQKLLWSQLFVLTDGHPDPAETSQTASEVTKVRLLAIDPGHIPVFTSLNRVFDNSVIKHEVAYIGMRAQDLFGMAKGMTFVLNPYSSQVKELPPGEIEDLLNGTIYEKIDKFEAERKSNERFNEVFKRAGARQEGLVLLDGYHQRKLTASDRLQLEESVKEYQTCLAIAPDHWQSMVLMAKSLQRLERHAEALEQLESAFRIELNSHIIPMEASLEAMLLNDFDKAIFYSEESLKRKPDDFALLGNYAMNLLIVKRDIEAKAAIEKAIKLQPDDPVNRNIESIVQGVISGSRKRPTFQDTIK